MGGEEKKLQFKRKKSIETLLVGVLPSASLFVFVL
jgi:hypothetical protein